MANLGKVVYLSDAQYTELVSNGSITVDGVTVVYNENDIYMTPQTAPVTSVNGQTGAVTVQPTLVSGTNIKTINGQSVLGEGDLAISGLPAVTSSDNGKVLTVVSGAWATASLPLYDGTVI